MFESSLATNKVPPYLLGISDHRFHSRYSLAVNIGPKSNTEDAYTVAHTTGVVISQETSAARFHDLPSPDTPTTNARELRKWTWFARMVRTHVRAVRVLLRVFPTWRSKQNLLDA